MEFRPCIDIHNGRVKQIIGGSLKDEGDRATDNFVSDKDAAWYATLYKNDNLKGAHVIMLNSKDSDFYEATKAQAMSALAAFPGGLQIGGGITADNAKEFIDAQASHVIVTSYAFSDGKVLHDNLKRLVEAVGKEHIVLDLSARRKDNDYYVVTDRWQKFTDEKISPELFAELSVYCDEFLVHGVDVEGKKSGLDKTLLTGLSQIAGNVAVPITYAGGITSFSDIDELCSVSGGKINYTIGSALDLFGGKLEYRKLVGYRGRNE